MCKIIVIVLLACVVFSSGLNREQTPHSDDKSSKQEGVDKYDLESRSDFDRTLEKEKELRLLRKAKKLRENNYRRAFQSLLPPNNSESYRKLFEDLLNKSDEKSKLAGKDTDRLGVPNSYGDDDKYDFNTSDSQVEEIEVVIERLTDDENDDTNSTTAKEISVPEGDKSTNPELLLQRSSSPDAAIDRKAENKIPLDTSLDVDVGGRSGQGSSTGMDELELRPDLEQHPVSRMSDLLIPHYRTTLTRAGYVVSPTVYTVQTATPIIDHVTTRTYLSNRRLLPDVYSRLANNKVKLIEDYNDFSANTYRYTPSMIPGRQNDKNVDLLSQLSDASMKSQFGNISPYRENVYPRNVFSRNHRHYSDGLRPLLGITR